MSARTSTGPRARLHALPALVAGAVLAALLATVPAPAHAASNHLAFDPTGDDHMSYGGNGVVMISGSISFEQDCAYYAPQGGVNDMFYPTSSVYIVPTGSATPGAQLTDAGGNGPNTIVGTTSGAFLGELIAVTTPSGSLGDGEYDVVFDTCEDGFVDDADDVFSEAITVDVPDGQVPPVDPSLRRMKDAARDEMASWLKFHMALTALFKLDDAKAIAGCLLAPNPACLIEVLAIIQDVDHSRAQHEDWIENMILGEMMNQAKHYEAIWKDPADADFERFPTLTAPDVREIPAAGQDVPDALAATVAPLAREGVLAEQLLHALERYQGAQAAGDSEWALVQARAVRDVSAALQAQLADSTAVDDLAATLTREAPRLVAAAEAGEDVADRIRLEGLTAAEQRGMANLGMTGAQVADVERRFVEQGAVHAPDEASLRADLAALVASRAELEAAVAETVDGWSEHVTAMEQTVEDLHPDADAGGPYKTTDDGHASLSATASQAGRDGARIVAADWDVDGDGQYDDASGFEVTVAVPTTRTVAVRVTDADGNAGVDLAHVTRISGDRPPVVGSASPATHAVTVVAGDSATFSVAATDPDGDPLTYEWTHRGEVVAGATDASYTLDTTAADLGAGTLSVRVVGASRSAAHTWVVSVVGPDADGDGWSDGPDCDDARTDVHPRATERPGNDVDDDCDPVTPDAPVGGLAGSVVAWGHPSGVGLPPKPQSDVPYWSATPVPSLGNQIRSIASVDRGGFAIDVDGKVWGWGENFEGRIGDGSGVKRWTPVPVLAVGGEPGTQLTGVRSIAGEWNHTLALLGNGRVLSWGSNLNQQLGTGDLVAQRSAPGVVVDAGGSPVDDAVQVETGENTSYAVTDDGRVRNWGVIHCDDDASATATRRRTADVNPLLGDGVVQVASGDGGGVFVLRADGSVWSCGGYENVLGRPYTNDTKNELHPVSGLGSRMVDVAMGSSVGVALDEDGRVFLWGKNLNHELDVLGKPAGDVQVLPAQVPLPDGPPVVDVVTDYGTSVHLVRADGSVLTFGASTYGSSGTGTTGIVLTPPVQQVAGLGSVRVLALRNSTWDGLALVRPVDDPAYQPGVSWVHAEVGDATVDEGSGGTATLTLSEPAPAGLVVGYRVGDGPVREVEVPAGATAVDLPVQVADDALDEDDETVPLSILEVSRGVRVDRATGVVTVVDDDAAPTVSAGHRTVVEGDTSLLDVAVPVTLDRASGKDVEVGWTATDEGGTELAHGRALVPAGELRVDVHVPVVGDATPGPDRQVAVTLADPVDATLGGDGRITVTDDDPVRLEVAAPTVLEGDAGTTAATFTLSAPRLPAGESVGVDWQVEPGTAELGSDVVDAHGTLVLDADHPTREVTVEVVGDRQVEALTTEVFGLALAGGLATSTGRPVLPTDTPTAVVTDDDEGPAVDAGVPLVLDEGGSVAVHGQSTADDTTWSVTGAAQCRVADASALDTTLTCDRSGDAELTLTGDDGINQPASATVAVTVRNVAPTVRITAPTAGSSTPLGQAVHLEAVATDPGGDPVTCTVTWGDGGSPAVLPGCAGDHAYAAAGSYQVTVAAVDDEGAAGSADVAVTVAGPSDPAFPFTGFFAPVDNPDVVNVVKAGSTVPVKFSLGGDRGLDVFRAGFPASSLHPCDSSDPSDALESTAAPGAATLTYDAGTDRYHFNWQTRKAWSGTCRTLVVTLKDGRSKTAEFKFR